jgi:hypothetical protein
MHLVRLFRHLLHAFADLLSTSSDERCLDVIISARAGVMGPGWEMTRGNEITAEKSLGTVEPRYPAILGPIS